MEFRAGAKASISNGPCYVPSSCPGPEQRDGVREMGCKALAERLESTAFVQDPGVDRKPVSGFKLGHCMTGIAREVNDLGCIMLERG